VVGAQALVEATQSRRTFEQLIARKWGRAFHLAGRLSGWSGRLEQWAGANWLAGVASTGSRPADVSAFPRIRKLTFLRAYLERACRSRNRRLEWPKIRQGSWYLSAACMVAFEFKPQKGAQRAERPSFFGREQGEERERERAGTKEVEAAAGATVKGSHSKHTKLEHSDAKVRE